MAEAILEHTAPAFLFDEHHVRLERACNDLLSEAYADDPRALCQRWRQFEAEVLDHINAEEELIVPAFEQVAPAEARAIRAEHAMLRDLLHRLGIEVDLHEIRLRTVRELIALLHEHAAREVDRGMYSWAADHLPTSRLGALRQRIESWLRLGD